MDPLLRKLNYKPPAPVTVLGAPAEVRPILDGWAGEVAVRERLGREEPFVLAFVQSRAEVAKQAKRLVRALAADAVLWMAYPKKSSKRYKSDVSRDDSWQPLGDLGYEAVRQVAIDDDWSALRFRPAESIGTLQRDPSGALSAQGRRRTVVNRFLASVPPERREMVEKVHDVIREVAPELEPELANGMLGFGKYHYRYASGREGDSYVVSLANQKQYVSLYLCGVVDGRYVAEANADRLGGKVSVGKSCIRFKKLDDLNLDVLRELVRTSADNIPAAG